jgi:hypothetical protein
MRYFLVSSILFVAGFTVYAQPVVTRVTENKKIAFGSLTKNAVMCHLSVDPENQNHLLISVTVGADPLRPNEYSTYMLSSFDQGKTWKYSGLASPDAADPWCIILSNNLAIAADIGNGSKFKQYVHRSYDGGVTWKDSLSFGDGHDHDMLIAGKRSGSSENSLYLFSTQFKRSPENFPRSEIFIARSEDAGKTFSQYHHSPFPNLDFIVKTPLVMEDGTLAVPLVTRGIVSAGQTDITAWAKTQSWLITSADQGKTFSQPLLITDLSGRRRMDLLAGAKNSKENLYYFFCGEDKKGIYVTRSSDKGVSWTTPLRIDRNQQSNFATDLGATVVTASGIIGITWMELTDQSSEKCYSLFFSASVNGGETFLPPVKVSSEKSCPGPETGWIGVAWPQGGDYSGLVPLSATEFLAVWADARNGRFELYQSRITVK